MWAVCWRPPQSQSMALVPTRHVAAVWVEPFRAAAPGAAAALLQEHRTCRCNQQPELNVHHSVLLCQHTQRMQAKAQLQQLAVA